MRAVRTYTYLVCLLYSTNEYENRLGEQLAVKRERKRGHCKVTLRLVRLHVMGARSLTSAPACSACTI